jgi:hypothetical protein
MAQQSLSSQSETIQRNELEVSLLAPGLRGAWKGQPAPALTLLESGAN